MPGMQPGGQFCGRDWRGHRRCWPIAQSIRSRQQPGQVWVGVGDIGEQRFGDRLTDGAVAPVPERGHRRCGSPRARCALSSTSHASSRPFSRPRRPRAVTAAASGPARSVATASTWKAVPRHLAYGGHRRDCGSRFSAGPRAVARRCGTLASESFCNTSLGGVVLVVAAALTRVLAVQVGLCNTCCVIMAEFQAL